MMMVVVAAKYSGVATFPPSLGLPIRAPIISWVEQNKYTPYLNFTQECEYQCCADTLEVDLTHY